MQLTDDQRLVRSVLDRNRNSNTTHKARSRPGMNDLANIVLNMYRDIKRVTNAIAPQSAAELVRKHNEQSPNHPWRLLKVDPNGPDTIDNCGDLNEDGVPDVVIQDSNGMPVFVNGYTTKRGNWPDDILYYSTLPTKEMRKQYKQANGKTLKDARGEPILDSNGEEIKVCSKKDFVRDYKKVNYYDIDSAPDPDAVGDIASTNAENLPQWYINAAKKYKFTEPKRLSAFKRYQKYVFQPAFAEATEKLVNENHIELTGQQKMVLFAKLSSQFWTQYTNLIINPGNNLSEADIAKLRKNKTIKQRFDQFVNTELNKIRSQEDYKDQFAAAVLSNLRSILGVQQPAAVIDDE